MSTPSKERETEAEGFIVSVRRGRRDGVILSGHSSTLKYTVHKGRPLKASQKLHNYHQQSNKYTWKRLYTHIVFQLLLSLCYSKKEGKKRGGKKWRQRESKHRTTLSSTKEISRWAGERTGGRKYYCTARTRFGLEGWRSRHVMPLGLVLWRVLLDICVQAETVSAEERSWGMALFFLFNMWNMYRGIHFSRGKKG